MRLLVYLSILALLAGCKKKESNYIIPAGTFKEILVDLHLADGIYMANYGKYQFRHTDSLNFYTSIFESFGYNRAAFDSTINYYINNPVKFDKLYDKVVDELNLLEQQFSKLRDFENDSSENLFKGKTRIYIPRDSRFTRVPFDIPINKDSARYEINVFAKKFSDDSSKGLRITAYFWYTDSITKEWVKEPLPEIEYSTEKYYSLYKTSMVYNGKRNGRLRGWILNCDPQEDIFKKHIDIKMIYIDKKALVRTR